MRFANTVVGIAIATLASASFAQPMQAPNRPGNGQEGARDQPGPEEQADLAAIARYQNALEGSLRASSSPRDWALSVQVMHADDREGSDPADAARGELLRKAAETAPNDRLVQWTWAIAPAEVSGCTQARPCRDRGAALARIEPGNAAAWVPAVADAVRFNDTPGVDAALAHMAAATRYDEVFHDAMNAWMNAFERFPLPADLMRTPDGKAGDRVLMAGSHALAQIGNATAPYDELLQACQRPQHATAATPRQANCARAGRLMIEHATTLVGRMVGADLLRSSAPPTAEDRERMRATAWLAEQHLRLSKENTDDRRARASMDLLIGSESEIAAIQDELRRANVALAPPAGWQPQREARPTAAQRVQDPRARDNDPDMDQR